MYKQSGINRINDIDYVLSLSVSRSLSYCINGRFLSSTVLSIIL